MQEKMHRNASSFSLRQITSDQDLRKLEAQQIQKLKQSCRITRLDSKQNLVKYKFFESISQLKELGAGVYYYFYFLKFFMIVFFILSLISLISIGMSVQGNGMEKYNEEGFFLKTTISNSHTSMLTQEQKDEIKQYDEQQKQDFFEFQNSQNTLQFHLSMTSDFLISFIFLIAIYTFQIIANKRIKSIDLKRPSARHFAIKIDRLPQGQIKEEEVQKFFEQFYQVKNVAFSYRFGEHFQTLVEINRMKENIKNFLRKNTKKSSKKYIKQKDKYYDKFKKLVKKVHQQKDKKFNLTNFQSFEVINAYIIFNNSEVPSKIYTEFKKAYSKSFFQKFFCRKKIIDKKYLFRGQYKIKISQPDHPGNFLWENMQYTQKFRRKRLALLYLVIFFIIILSFVSNLFLTAYTNSNKGQKCEDTYQVQDIDTNNKSIEMRKYIYCYCAQFPFYYLFKQKHESYDVCGEEYLKQIQDLIIMISIAVIISVINYLIQTVIFKMVDYIKYSTLTESIIKQINLTLIAEYCNTAFVLMLIYKKTFNIELPQIFNTLTNSNFFRLNQTDNFDRFWYILVAKKLFIPFLLLCFNPHVSEWVVNCIKAFVTSIRLKYIKNKKKFIETYQLETFNLGYKFKNVLKLVIVCFTFSSGIPIFNIFIFVGLFFIFVFHKIILINYSGKVPPYSVDIIKSTFKVLKASLIIHLIFSILFFSDFDIYPNENQFFADLDIVNESQNEFLADLISRIYQAFPLFCLLIFTLLCIFFEVFVIGLFQQIIDYITKKKIKTFKQKKTYDEVKKQLKNTAIQDYQILSNPFYNNILNFNQRDLMMLKTLLLDKSLGQIVHLYSSSHQNLGKLATIENNCLENFDEENQDIVEEKVDISQAKPKSIDISNIVQQDVNIQDLKEEFRQSFEQNQHNNLLQKSQQSNKEKSSKEQN